MQREKRNGVWRMLLCGSKRRKMSQSMIETSLLCVLISVAIAVCAIGYFTFQLVVGEKGKARVDVLQQISDSNSVNRTNMVKAMDALYEDFYDDLTAPKSEKSSSAIQTLLEQTDRQFKRIGMDMTIDILMNDRRMFSTDPDENNLKSLKNTYWYIKHYSGETDTSWNLRFWDVDDISTYGLAYGKTVYAQDGKVVGTIVLTSRYEALFRTFQKLVSDGVKVYILDRNGIIISHTNPNRVGNWAFDMKTFQGEYGRNTYKIIQRSKQKILIANYHDASSGWTFVEEQNMDELLWDGLKTVRNCLTIVLLGCIVAASIAYWRGRRITQVLSDFTDEIGDMSAEKLSELPVKDEYEETYVLSTTFNGMIHRIEELIDDIRIREKEKQRTEYDFLQAQINPHFLNNTLLSVKSLIAMHQPERAYRMMNELVELLHIPATPEIQFVPLEEELHLMRSYMSIMNCRTEKDTVLICEVPEKMYGIYVPRMIVQPIIGNAFFHGFAEREEGCEIRLRAGLRGNALYIEVTDNGEGIAPKRLEQVQSGNYRSERLHHGIGLRNVRKRLQIIYGGRSDVTVRSELGKYTTVTITMDHYRSIPKREQGGEVNEDHSS